LSLIRGVAGPSGQRLFGVRFRRLVIEPRGIEKVELILDLRPQLVEHLPGCKLLQPLLVPVRHLATDEDADHDDDELDRDRRPVLDTQIFGQTAQDHLISPARSVTTSDVAKSSAGRC
jgi:hypothetical protein